MTFETFVPPNNPLVLCEFCGICLDEPCQEGEYFNCVAYCDAIDTLERDFNDEEE
jgi:hypothetical protein